MATLIYTPLNGTYFNGSEAEWIFERPGLSGGTLAQLSDYERGSIIGAWALTTAGKWTDYSKTSNLLLERLTRRIPPACTTLRCPSLRTAYKQGRMENSSSSGKS